MDETHSNGIFVQSTYSFHGNGMTGNGASVGLDKNDEGA